MPRRTVEARWGCPYCRKTWSDKSVAEQCAFTCYIAERATEIWATGVTVSGLFSMLAHEFPNAPAYEIKMPSEAERFSAVTKDHCFVVSHWQCCDRPAYRITAFAHGLIPILWGKGGWMGMYGGEIRWKDLGKVHEPTELYVDPR